MRSIATSGRAAAMTAAALLVFTACQGDETTGGALDREADLAAAVDAGGDFPEVTPQLVTKGVPVESTSLVGNETWTCTTTTYDSTSAPDRFPLFDPNAEVVWPGSLLQGKSLGDATPSPIPVRRGAGTVVLTLMSGIEGGVSRRVNELSMASVFDAANDILATAPEQIPARFTFTMERVDSETQLRLAAGASVKGWGADVSTSLAFSRDQSYNRFLVKLTQSFYTLAVEPPGSVAEAFAPGVTAAQLAGHVGPGNPAAYVSSVTYGRIFYLLFESTERVTRIESALNASFSGWGVDVGGNLEANYLGRLANLRVKAFALGGDAGAAIMSITTDFEKMQQFLAQGGTIRTGVPISYVVRSVRHPEKVVSVALNDEYDVTDCRPLAETFGAPVLWYAADDVRVKDASGAELVPTSEVDVTLWRDRSEAVNDAYVDRLLNVRPRYKLAAVNGIAPAIEFSGDAALHFFGGAFSPPPGEPAEYTVSMVAALQPQGAHLHLLDGATGSPGRVLRIGFRTPGEFGFDNGTALGAYAPYSFAASGFHVYTFVFSEATGMALYVDGAPFASAASAREPLTDFLGAHLGMNDPVANGRVTLAEIMAHRTALTAEQRRFVERDLMRKYRF